MRRLFLIVLIMVFTLIVCNASNTFDNELNNNEKMEASSGSSTSNNMESVIYGRFGEKKGIYAYNEYSRNQREVFDGDYDSVASYKDMVLIYTNNIDESVGGKQKKAKYEIYLANLSDNQLKLILSDYSVDDGMTISPDGKGFVFIGSKKNSRESSVFYMNFNEKEPRKIMAVGRKVRDLTFFDSNTLLYSKTTPVKINDKVDYIYQIYKCPISTGMEERFITSSNNDVNPVISPDGTKLIFLRMIKYKYTLHMMDLSKNNEIVTLNRDDAVIGGSIQWAKDGSYIIYINEYVKQQGFNQVTQKEIKGYLFRGNKGTIELDNNGYIATISPDGEYIIYAECSINTASNGKEKTRQVNQVIYRRRVGDKKSEIVFSFPEKGPYNLSINMIRVFKNYSN